MNKVFRKLSANNSLIVACLQIDRVFKSGILTSLTNKYPSLKTTFHIKLKLFL